VRGDESGRLASGRANLPNGCASPGPATGKLLDGDPQLVRPRLGQGTFRIAVSDAYGKACAITNEHSLPVLEAAHIQPYGKHGPHEVSNGLLLRSDIHRLFDDGWVTVTPDFHFVVSRRLREEFDNGKTYYALDGNEIRLPRDPRDRPLPAFLQWHNEAVFRC
jgi:putative restriction endonuclease